jgi:hypothetical protein
VDTITTLLSAAIERSARKIVPEAPSIPCLPTFCHLL